MNDLPKIQHPVPKVPKPKENLIRRLLQGDFKNGWVHGQLEIEIQAKKIILRIYSLEDKSLIKESEYLVNNGDLLVFRNSVWSFQVSFSDS